MRSELSQKTSRAETIEVDDEESDDEDEDVGANGKNHHNIPSHLILISTL